MNRKMVSLGAGRNMAYVSTDEAQLDAECLPISFQITVLLWPMQPYPGALLSPNNGRQNTDVSHRIRLWEATGA